jgi:hypothetical protein
MNLPRGLSRPHHIAEILPVLVVFAIVVWGTIALWIYFARTGGL